MPDRIVGIYGYDFTHAFTVGGIEFVPFFGVPASRARATDRNALQLTGFGRFLSPGQGQSDADMARLITDGMTFVQQQDVAASLLIDISADETVESVVQREGFRRPLSIAHERHTFGSVVVEDAWYRDSRSQFLTKFVERFLVEDLADPMRKAFFRQIAVSRLAIPFVEISHFLSFSALELLARSRGQNADNANAAVPIRDLLNELGFSVQQVEVERWTRARNAAFHRGELESVDPAGGPPIRLIDQVLTINNVVVDVLLKLLPFDDGHINWNRWRDRQPFI